MAKNNSAELILEEVGGKGNVVHLTHCATRLRFTLKDATIIDDKKVDKIPGVLGVVPQGKETYQIVIGGGVADMYQEINSLLEKSGSSKTPAKKSNKKNMTDDEVKAEQRNKIKGKNQLVDKFFEFLSDSFRPIIGVLLGASLIIAILNLLISFGVISDASDTPSTMFLNCIAQSVFYFLPILIAHNACKKLKVDPWVGTVCMLALFTPQFMALMTPEIFSTVFSADGPGLSNAIASLSTINNPVLGDNGTVFMTKVFGLPLTLVSYKGNVFVPLLMSGVLALIYKGLKKIIPSSVQLVFVPFLSMLITVPLTAFIIGPLGVAGGSLLGFGLSWLNSNAPFIFAIAIPMLYPFLVPLGLHWPLNALMLLNIDTLGYDFIQGPMGCWNFACFGATFGVLIHSIREQNKEMSSVAGGALAAGFLGGVSEPSLYGIHLRYKKVYSRLLCGCAAGGITIAVLGFLFPSTSAPGVTTTAFAFTSLLTIPVFNQVWVYAISIAVAFFVAAFMVIVFDYRTPAQKAKMRAVDAAEKLGIVDIDNLFLLSEEDQNKMTGNEPAKEDLEIDILAPVAGKVVDLKDSGDPVFAMKALGEGVAIIPEAKKLKIVSPVTGVITSIAPAEHAFTIMTEEGAGVLIHVGIQTVALEGNCFEAKVKDGDIVQPGKTLSVVDFKAIKESGFDIPVIMTIVNTNEVKEVKPLAIGEEVKTKNVVLNVKN